MSAPIELDEFLWREADLIDAITEVIIDQRMGSVEAVQYLRECAVQVRRASSNATAGRELAA
jgi:hypothetical protein